MININVQITYVLVVLMFENLPEKTLVNHKTLFNLQKIVRQQQAFASYYIAPWESFLSSSWYFFEIAAPIKAEKSAFHIFRIFLKKHPLIHLKSCPICKADSAKEN